MEYNVIINQAALAPWIKARKIDIKDAHIIGFIRALSPDDPAVGRHMLNGYYRLKRSWMLKQVPLLDITEDRLGRRLKHLESVGLVDLVSRVDEKHQYCLYGRLSKLYFQWERQARQKMDEVGVDTDGAGAELGANAHGCPSPAPTVPAPIDHKENDHKDGNGAAPSGGAAAVPPEEKNSDQLELELLENLRKRAEGGEEFAKDRLRQMERRAKAAGKGQAPHGGGVAP